VLTRELEGVLEEQPGLEVPSQAVHVGFRVSAQLARIRIPTVPGARVVTNGDEEFH
jgi:hypothetical protein